MQFTSLPFIHYVLPIPDALINHSNTTWLQTHNQTLLVVQFSQTSSCLFPRMSQLVLSSSIKHEVPRPLKQKLILYEECYRLPGWNHAETSVYFYQMT